MTDHKWLTDTDPFWTVSNDDGNYAELAPYEDDIDEGVAEEGFTEQEFSLRLALTGDVEIQIDTAKDTNAAYAELSLTGRELEDLYLEIQRLRGEAQDAQIVAQRRKEAEEAEARERKAAEIGKWQRWADEHPWVIVKLNPGHNAMGRTYNGKIHHRRCKHGSEGIPGVYHGFTADEILSLERNKPVREGGEVVRPTDWRNISRCKVCTSDNYGWDGLPVLDEQEQDEPSHQEQPGVEAVNLDSDFRRGDPIMVTGGEHAGHAGQFVEWKAGKDDHAVVALYYLTKIEGPVVVPADQIEREETA